MRRVYLDANATTPVLPEAVDAMRPYFGERFGNPSSAHAAGQGTRAAVEHARTAVASLLQCTAKEIVFTSGGTESDNLALTGVLEPLLHSGARPHLVTTAIEHHAVLYTAQALAARGVEVTYVAPQRDGTVDPAAFEAALQPNTRLVSVMLANNETGVIQPVGKLARIAKAHGDVLVHTDAVQAAGKLPLQLGDASGGELKNVDLLTLSGHKMYAPQGTGALFVRKGLVLAPLFHGGPHERQRRAGTENVPGIVGLGVAAASAQQWLAAGEATHLAARRDRFEAGLLAALPDTHVNAGEAPRTPNTANLRFAGVDAEALLIALDLQGVAASFGAACQSGATEPSHVLLAMGATASQARESVRFSLSRFTTDQDIEYVTQTVAAVVRRLRSIR